MKVLLTIIMYVGLFAFKSNAQSIFPEKFDNCDTSHFGMESDSLSVTVPDNELISAVNSAMSEKDQRKIKGTLAIQVLVDQNGKSCLLSLKNETNIKTGKLNLASAINEKLVWNGSDYQVAAVVAISYNPSGISIKRFGMNGSKGFHELK